MGDDKVKVNVAQEKNKYTTGYTLYINFNAEGYESVFWSTQTTDKIESMDPKKVDLIIKQAERWYGRKKRHLTPIRKVTVSDVWWAKLNDEMEKWDDLPELEESHAKTSY